MSVSKGIVWVLLALVPAALPAQNVPLPPVAAVVLDYGDFMEQILAFHPLARQAALAGKRGEALLRKSRGLFDPYLYGEYAGKQYAGTEYYQRLEAGVKVPTWLGMQGFAGYQRNSGDYLNPADNLPDQGLLQAGLEVNLGRGLLIDRRRTELLKAKWYPAIAEAEQRVLLNGLVVDATTAYWDWWGAWNEMMVYQEAVSLAEARFRGVRSGYLSGDEPAIDTLESRIQVQTRIFNYNQARLKYAQASLELSNYLWDASGEPLLLADGVVPPSVTRPAGPSFADSLPDIASLLAQHPDLLGLELKKRQLEVDQRWAAEQLKPELSLKAGALMRPGGNTGDQPFYENGTLGMKLSFPLFLRKARGELALADLEVRATGLKLEQKAWTLETKINTLLAKISNIKIQIDLYAETATNYSGLMKAEARKFELGESSLFLVNAREQNLIAARLGLIRLQADLPVLLAQLYEAAGGYGILY